MKLILNPVPCTIDLLDLVQLLKGARVSKIDRAELNLKQNKLDDRVREQARQRNRERDPVAADAVDKIRELFGEARVVYVGPRRPRA